MKAIKKKCSDLVAAIDKVESVGVLDSYSCDVARQSLEKT